MSAFDKAPEPTHGSEHTCIACGEKVSEKDSWEWDKHGNRWDREGKEFEAMCKGCFNGLSTPKRGRQGIEKRATAVEKRARTKEDFINIYMQHASNRTGNSEDREDLDPA